MVGLLERLRRSPRSADLEREIEEADVGETVDERRAALAALAHNATERETALAPLAKAEAEARVAFVSAQAALERAKQRLDTASRRYQVEDYRLRGLDEETRKVLRTLTPRSIRGHEAELTARMQRLDEKAFREIEVPSSAAVYDVRLAEHERIAQQARSQRTLVQEILDQQRACRDELPYLDDAALAERLAAFQARLADLERA